MINRAKIYILPYFIFSMIGALVHIAWGYWAFINREMFWSLFITCMPNWLYIDAGWFLIASFWGNIFFYFWINLLENNEKVTATEKCVLLFIVIYLAVRILEFNIISVPQYNRLPWRIDSGLMAFAFMLIGHYIKKYNVIEKYQKLPVWIVSVYLFFSIAKANGWPNIANCSYNNGVYYYLAAVLGSFLIMSLALWIDKVKILSKALGVIGKLSLPMFMLHGMFLSYMNTHMGIVTGTVPLKSASWYALLLVIVVLPFVGLYAKCFGFIQKKIRHN